MTIARTPIITVIGDSTIDNKIWVWPGFIGNVLRSRLRIKRASSESRIAKNKRPFFKPELSVVEHLKKCMPDYQINDFTNDGFTTSDVLNGAHRDKVFGRGTVDLFPHTFFSPLDEGKESIRESDYVVVSVGGNNIREFLQRVFAYADAKQRKRIIQLRYPEVMRQLKEQYLQIVARIREQNPNAKIIIMTQYYPSVMQNNYRIYSFMHELGAALGYGNEPTDVIHRLMIETYQDVLRESDQTNMIVADVTSTLNPFNKKNHIRQIEPSGHGGNTIARLLKYIVAEGDRAIGRVYHLDQHYITRKKESFTPQFTPLAEWTPQHPHTFTDMECHQLLKRIAERRDRYEPAENMYQACDQVYREGSRLLNHLLRCQNAALNKSARKMRQEVHDLRESLNMTLAVFESDNQEQAIIDLKVHAKKRASGKPSVWKKFLGSIFMLAGLAAIAAGFAAMPITAGLSATASVAGLGLFAAGAATFHSGRQKGLSESLDRLADMAEVERTIKRMSA